MEVSGEDAGKSRCEHAIRYRAGDAVGRRVRAVARHSCGGGDLVARRPDSFWCDGGGVGGRAMLWSCARARPKARARGGGRSCRVRRSWLLAGRVRWPRLCAADSERPAVLLLAGCVLALSGRHRRLRGSARAPPRKRARTCLRGPAPPGRRRAWPSAVHHARSVSFCGSRAPTRETGKGRLFRMRGPRSVVCPSARCCYATRFWLPDPWLWHLSSA